MSQGRREMNGRVARAGMAVAVIGLSLLPGACTVDHGPPLSTSRFTPHVVGAGSIAHWDPVRRRFVEPPPDVVKSLQAAPAARAAQAGLREEDSPRGGKMVRVGDRFQHQAALELGAGGVATSTCAQEPRPVGSP